eukprot:TRINITY_DN82613_c0_g1_i1.p1 TRINITY_DN82613_c0_g1~~TRINITY_DN82613_c0_g1_i1.p1  ORF type:complete len:547 (+),score=90.02 TRINITY_DN82613_c0_g1_i1:79-1719(+)
MGQSCNRSDAREDQSKSCLLEGAAHLPHRVTISEQGVYVLDGAEVVLLGGNYGSKAPPYFPPLEVVQKNARSMAEGLKASSYQPPPAADGSPRRVVPMVRLMCFWEHAMPDGPGPIDSGFKANLEAVVKAFADEGIYIALDCHQDALCTTNGGEGLPWWVTAKMQETSDVGCCTYGSGCCGYLGPCGYGFGCCGGASYITSSEHPLQSVLPCGLASCAGLQITTAAGETDPWKEYSAAGNSGDPARMNLGNKSIRLNNQDSTWGRLLFTKQVQNVATRLYSSPYQKSDRAFVFEPYMTFIKYLCDVWDRNYNVIAVGLLNEPPLAGVGWNLCDLPAQMRRVGSFYEQVLAELDAAQVAAPVSMEFLIGGQLPGMATYDCIFGMVPFSSTTIKRVKEWADRGQAILEFHFYPGNGETSDLAKVISAAKKDAARLSSRMPIYMGEFDVGESRADYAKILAEAVSLGCNMSAYWGYADIQWTGTQGWWKFSQEVMQAGGGKPPIDGNGSINEAGWPAYAKTVADGSFWGAWITGAAGMEDDVLELLPAS